MVDLSYLIVEKKSQRAEMFSRIKLYSGIFYATQASKIKNRELFVDKITREIEEEIMNLKRKRVLSSEITEIVLTNLKKKSIPTFLRFLTYNKDILSELQLKRELKKYLDPF